MVGKEHKHFFNGLEIGDMTDKGKIDDLFFMTWGAWGCGYKTSEPCGKGLLMATINGKDCVIGELKKIV